MTLTTEEESVLTAAGPDGYLSYRHGSSKTRNLSNANEQDEDDPKADIEVIDNNTNGPEEDAVENSSVTSEEPPENEEADENDENKVDTEAEVLNGATNAIETNVSKCSFLKFIIY